MNKLLLLLLLLLLLSRMRIQNTPHVFWLSKLSLSIFSLYLHQSYILAH